VQGGEQTFCRSVSSVHAHPHTRWDAVLINCDKSDGEQCTAHDIHSFNKDSPTAYKAKIPVVPPQVQQAIAQEHQEASNGHHDNAEPQGDTHSPKEDVDAPDTNPANEVPEAPVAPLAPSPPAEEDKYSDNGAFTPPWNDDPDKYTDWGLWCAHEMEEHCTSCNNPKGAAKYCKSDCKAANCPGFTAHVGNEGSGTSGKTTPPGGDASYASGGTLLGLTKYVHDKAARALGWDGSIEG